MGLFFRIWTYPGRDCEGTVWKDKNHPVLLNDQTLLKPYSKHIQKVQRGTSDLVDFSPKNKMGMHLGMQMGMQKMEKHIACKGG